MNPILSLQAVDFLLAWYRTYRRDLPWRHTKDPYRIWISEIMLQQTRVEAVKPYYARFLEACPTVQALAELPEERLMKLWEGLGYYSRARNLQKAARTIVNELDGRMPQSYEGLRALPGIGDYTAGAIASIAFDLRVPAVDGNVLRVLARVSGSTDDIAAQETKQRFRAELAKVIPAEAGDFAQAMIELGATVCVPNGAPKCALCPLASECVAHLQGLTDFVPVRSAKKARRVENRTVLLIRDGNRTALRKRAPKGLLAGLYELPNTEGHLSEAELPDYIRSLGTEPLQIQRLEDAKHIFTHIEWHMIAYAVRVSPDFDGLREDADLLLVPNEELHRDYAIPSAFSAYTKYL
ncbi:MAG: A/G-specific adenine glycosylase [Clostridia bacterium]|nr:A/G-specific adenine glycosylase [Clostridia bacterium]